MPNRWAVANGNWSSTATWNSGAALGIPTGSDDIFANNFTVNVDQSFSVLSLNNTAAASVSAGGTFNFNSGSISGSLTGITPLSFGAINLVTCTNTTDVVSLSCNNNISLNSNLSSVILDSGRSTFIITAPSIITNSASFEGRFVISKNSNGTLIINGNLQIIGGGDATTPRVIVATAGDIIVNGNLSGPTTLISNIGSTSSTIVQSGGNLRINGNVLPSAGVGVGTHLVVNFTGTRFELTGSITAGSSYGAVSLNCTNISISGSIVAGTGPSALSVGATSNISIIGQIVAGSVNPAITSAAAHTLTHSGSIAASAGSPAIVSTSTAATNIFTGPFINNGPTMAVQAARMFLATGSTSWQFTSEAVGVSQSLFTADQIPTYPSASNVRLGTTYASGSLIGTLAMPTANSVQFGVPVDNTTGSAVLTTASLASAIWDRPRTSLTTTGSIGERLQNVSTPASVGTQIASYLL